jgi:hypothetical protein
MAEQSIVNSHARFLQTPNHFENCRYRVLEVDHRVFSNDFVVYLQGESGCFCSGDGIGNLLLTTSTGGHK